MAPITTGTSHQLVESFPSSQGDRVLSVPSDQVSRQRSCHQRESDPASAGTLDDCGCRRNLLLEYSSTSCLFQSLQLKVQVLLKSRNARIADFHLRAR